MTNFVNQESKKCEIFPPKNLIFECLNHFDLSETKIVILGQDPYYRRHQANGLCFSVPIDIQNPPSLRNIFTEIKNSTGKESICKSGDLTAWAEQGILLLNTALTVIEGKPNSHKRFWAAYTDKIIQYISDKGPDGIIFILWGGNAQKKRN